VRRRVQDSAGLGARPRRWREFACAKGSHYQEQIRSGEFARWL